MSPNYLSLSDIGALRAIIATHNFRASREYNAARLLEQHLLGISSVNSVCTDRIFQGLPMRGAQTRITMEKENFGCEGAMYLFGSVLNEFLAIHATAYSFQQVIIIEAKTGAQYPFPPAFGSRRRR